VQEFELIDYIKKKFLSHSSNKNLILPISDDCSVIKPPKGRLQVTTADSLVEGNHFTSRYFTPREIGRKVIRVNLSDMASMGAVGPYYAWLTFTLPPNTKDSLIKGILDGFAEDAGRYGITLAGGNITGAKLFSIHLTLSGWAKPGEILTRSGAKVGDSIFLSGSVGASSVAYRDFKSGKKPSPALLKRWANPDPKIKLGIWLAKNRIANSCIDVSDGIFQDLAHITGESGVGAVIEWEKIPVFNALKRLNPTPKMIGFGEDYELLFTVPKSKLAKFSAFKGKITRIGEIVKSGMMVLDKSGKRMTVKGTGYKHST
jgi:thiamine-monophosphate kinase